MQWQQGLYSANISHYRVNIRRREKEKFPQKVLVWLANDENGKISEYFFMKEGYMSQIIFVYFINKCFVFNDLIYLNRLEIQ